MSRARLETGVRPRRRHVVTVGLGVCVLSLLGAVPVVLGALTGSVSGTTLGYLLPFMSVALLTGLVAFSFAE